MIVDIEADRNRHVALQFLDPLHDFELCGRVEHVAGSPQEQLQMLRHVPAAEIDSLNGIADREALEDGTAMADTVAAIEDDARSLSSGIQTQDGLLLEENLWRAKLLEKDVCSLHAITVRIQWRLSQKNRMLLRRGLQLIENMPPKLFHIVPVLNDSVLNRVVELQDSPVFIL